jgi:mRNA interferase MazF
LKQLEIWWADLPVPIGRRPVLLLTRDRGYEVLHHVTVAEVTTTVRGIPVEVPLGKREGLDRACVANLDNLHAVAVSRLVERAGMLSQRRVAEVWRALGFAMNIPVLKAFD